MSISIHSLPGKIICIHFILMLLLLISCAGNKDAVKESKPLVYDETFDPMTLNDEDIIIKSGHQTDTIVKNSTGAAKANAREEIQGFRVQIIALKDLENASLMEQEVCDQFQLHGYKTYFVFAAPFYRITVGDCLDRKCAEELLAIARDQFGYKEALIITSVVQKSE